MRSFTQEETNLCAFSQMVALLDEIPVIPPCMLVIYHNLLPNNLLS